MRKSLFYLHSAILLAGATGLFGRLISLSELPLVWYRMMFALVIAVPLFAFMNRRSGSSFSLLPVVSFRDSLLIAGCGMLMAVHWVFFYGSIQASNVSVGVICLTLVSFFTAIFEPLFGRRKPSVREIILSLLPVIGIMLIFHLDIRYRTGILFGVASSAFCSLFSIGSKRVIELRAYKSSTMLIYELLGGVILITVLIPFVSVTKPDLPIVPQVSDLFYLILLASIFTVGHFLLQLMALKGVSAFTMTLSYNLEPVYSILYAMILFDEGSELGRSFWFGVLLIVISVLLQTIIVRRH